MPHYKYLIVGGGMTADAAVQGIRQVDQEGSIGLVGSESHPPYDRPLLSKGLWKGKRLESIWRKAAADDATLHLGRKVLSLDAPNNRVTDDQGTVYDYEKLLLATGGTPRRLDSDTAGVIYFRTLDDYLQLRRLADEKQRFAVIGGGFIGSEIAAALAANGKEVILVFPEEGIGGRMFPPDLAGFLNQFYGQKGVEVRGQERVVGVEARKDRFTVKTASAETQRPQEIVVDAVVAGLGIQPNVELAHDAGLEVGGGIHVDRALATSRPNIYAAGDAAEFFNPALGTHLRVEHEDNANTMGEMAGRSMAGEPVSYDRLPFFYSDLFELGYEAVGQVDSRLEMVADWKEPYREGVVYYLHGGRVRGALLWNVWERVDAARRLIAQTGPFQSEDLKGRLLDPSQHM
jgi:3-phenylpropionate/trans-cinnamate dioxygenase ferredoxin reductase subunit